jgi:hypothetical protein
VSEAKDGPLERIVAVAATQLDLLEDARRRPEIDRAGLAETALELVLKGIAAEARAAGLDTFAQRHAAFAARGGDAQRHLIALGEGWACRHCKNDVVRSVQLARVDDRWKASLVCRACGRVSPIAPLGTAALARHFGALLEDADWDPTDNGFEVAT